MSMLTSQVENLRIMARLVREYEYREISWALRHAADTIENLRNRLTERETCRNAAPEYLDFLCSECGFVHYHSDENDDGDGNDWSYCPRCGRWVVDG